MPKKKNTTRNARPAHVRVGRSAAGLGLFAATDIAKGDEIIEYVGERIKADTRDNKYIFNVNKKVDIDGSPRWNTARYINHSCRPNAEAVNRGGRIFIEAIKKIKAGDEITYHYGKEYFTSDYIQKHGCKCPKCSPELYQNA